MNTKEFKNRISVIIDYIADLEVDFLEEINKKTNKIESLKDEIKDKDSDITTLELKIIDLNNEIIDLKNLIKN